MQMHEGHPVTGGTHAIDGQAIGDPKPLSREVLITRWKEAKYDPNLVRYGPGYNTDQYGKRYRYPAGARLVILGEPVMDTCETPWSRKAVDLGLEALGPKENVEFIERGYGLGGAAKRAGEHLDIRGGNYTGIELNNQVADYAEDWAQRQLVAQEQQRVMGEDSNGAANIGIRIIRGDAIEETRKLARRGKGYDIFLSDTYPLSPEEEGINDISDLDTVIQCLNKGGVFIFFGYHPGLKGDLDRKQEELIRSRFDDIQIRHVAVRPPKSYKYLNTPEGAVTRLPIIICKNPIIYSAS